MGIQQYNTFRLTLDLALGIGEGPITALTVDADELRTAGVGE